MIWHWAWVPGRFESTEQPQQFKNVRRTSVFFCVGTDIDVRSNNQCQVLIDSQQFQFHLQGLGLGLGIPLILAIIVAVACWYRKSTTKPGAGGVVVGRPVDGEGTKV